MKCIVRIGQIFEGAEQLQSAKLSSFGARQLADAYARVRDKHPDGIMIVEPTEKGTVFLMVSPRPPEIAAGHAELHGVFWPIDCQEPVATFMEEQDAQDWADAKYSHLEGELSEWIVRPVDATHKLGVQVSLMTIIYRDDGHVLFCRMRNSGQWTLPEGTVGLGESVRAASERSVLETVGLEIENVGKSALAPYVNTYFRTAGQHFVTLIMRADYKAGDAAALDEHYDQVEWFPAKHPPQPRFPVLQGLIAILAPHTPQGEEDDAAAAT